MLRRDLPTSKSGTEPQEVSNYRMHRLVWTYVERERRKKKKCWPSRNRNRSDSTCPCRHESLSAVTATMPCILAVAMREGKLQLAINPHSTQNATSGEQKAQSCANACY
jgi:hypothetical protein